MSNLAFNITPTSVVVMIDAQTYTVGNTDERYNQVVSAIREGRTDDIPTILDVKGRLVSESNGGLYLLNGILRCDRYEIPNTLAQRIIQSFQDKTVVFTEYLTNFLDLLMQNPNESGTVVEELFDFITACDLPLTPEGHFLAYKIVDENFMDLHTGTMDNSVGKVVEMPRELCDFDRDNTCSRGLHYCSKGYLGSYGNRYSTRVLVVKVNPKDVTSIPSDHNNEKGRACRYEVVDTIDRDELIRPWTEDRYSDEPEVDLDALDAAQDADEDLSNGMYDRWIIRDSEDGSFINSFVTREDARDYIRVEPNTFIWDDHQLVVAGGVLSPDLADFIADGGQPGEFGLDQVEVPTPVPTPTGAKLTRQDVAEIKAELNDLESGESDYEYLYQIADQYGVSERSVRRIRDGEAWVDVEPAW